ncbi:hypothetical protein [Gorillibacterium sp. CAU 1737]|uniref:hypothetical protein n=1 Tax=Gorillibacterium sp. CAU 1737 TaxID=3140362 RepID=UPI00326142B5
MKKWGWVVGIVLLAAATLLEAGDVTLQLSNKESSLANQSGSHSGTLAFQENEKNQVLDLLTSGKQAKGSFRITLERK